MTTHLPYLLGVRLGWLGKVIVLIIVLLYLYVFLKAVRIFWKVVRKGWVWLLIRISPAYTIPLMALFLFYWSLLPFLIYPLFQGPDLPLTFNNLTPTSAALWGVLLLALRSFVAFAASVVGVVMFPAVFLLANGNAVKIHDRWLKRFTKIRVRRLSPVESSATNKIKAGNPLANYQRIGIILAGGGAKGAYQAGAMKAIHDFISECDAHNKVKMIAGTSIGSWNALFWLAKLVASEEKGKGALQEWWENISLKRVIKPIAFVPFYRDNLFSAEPWVKSFNAIFGQMRIVKELKKYLPEHLLEGDLHFYLTSTNITRGTLECTTNNKNASKKSARAFLHDVSRFNLVKRVKDIRDAVFTSMALPLVFEPIKVKGEAGGDEFYADGGIADNLPVWFGAEVEECDLLFVLPLNASFESDIGKRLLLNRLFRVTDIRQGILERRSLMMIDSYNRHTRLQNAANDYRKSLEEIHEKLSVSDPQGAAEIADLINKHDVGAAPNRKEIRVFAICPGTNIPESRTSIKTIEFWKNKEAGEAFSLMEEVTRRELEKFFNSETPDSKLIIATENKVTYQPI